MKSAAISLSIIMASGLPALAQLSQDSMSPIRFEPVSMGANARTALPDRNLSLDTILKAQPLPTYPVEPVALDGIKIPGATPNTVRTLGLNHFAVINNTPFETMADVYKDNRLRGKPNFVTADCLVHSYLASTNGLVANIVEKHLTGELKSLLAAMIGSSIADYRASDDTEVKDDIQRNLAYLLVAVKLLDPAYQGKDMGGATDLSEEEMVNISAGKRARSAIFDRSEDFADLKPSGWYRHSEKLRNFYQCAQWMSRMYFPLTDVTVDTRTGSGNLFRRSVLLYRSLEQARVNGQKAYEVWERIASLWELLGTNTLGAREKTLMVSDYKPVLPDAGSDLKATLVGLAQPFFRTKLLLSVKKQKPVGLGATSIFELKEGGSDREGKVVFRLMPLIEDPEMPWLKARAKQYLDEEKGGAWTPLALFILHGRGAQGATNLLAQSSVNLDPEMVNLLPELQKNISKSQGGRTQFRSFERIWQILGGYFKTFPEGAQQALRTDLWHNRHLESAFAAWVDHHLSISSGPSPADQSTTLPGASQPRAGTAASAAPQQAVLSRQTSSALASQQAPSALPSQQASSALPSPPPSLPVKPASFHYLEPCSEIYQSMLADAQYLTDKLNSLSYLSPDDSRRLADFARLFQRLKAISDQEIAGQPISPVDFKLLAGIDMILERVAAPLEGSLNIQASTDGKEPQTRGANLILGRPGQVLMIFNTSQGAMLGRGAVYTYYEMEGAPLKPEHLKRKLDFGMLRPPVWTQQFDVVQETITRR